MNYSKVTALLSCSISFSDEIQDFTFRQTLIPHIKAGYQYAAELNIQKEYDKNIYSKFSFIFRKNEDWAEAEKLYVQVMINSKRLYGDEDSYTLLSMIYLAISYKYQGKWSKAEQLEK